ncbi:hypothetical protein CI610_03202 [invertebrate metagenome]|uniref:Uncharacterized protein n=1 Tax=invertebrate metagenome TaxID=1711999 RepID=A0A2H9T3T1_9ZZZZ
MNGGVVNRYLLIFLAPFLEKKGHDYSESVKNKKYIRNILGCYPMEASNLTGVNVGLCIIFLKRLIEKQGYMGR